MKPFADIQGKNIDCNDEGTPAKKVEKVRLRHLGCQTFPASLAACELQHWHLHVEAAYDVLSVCRLPQPTSQHHSQ